MSLICHLSGVHMDTLTCPCNEVALCFYRKMCYPGETSYAWAVTIFQKYSAASPLWEVISVKISILAVLIANSLFINGMLIKHQ